jgi:anti-anti-sigma regulatory factor
VGEALKAELAARGPSVKHVLVDAESVNLIDTTACDALLSIVKELQSRGITLAFARVRDEVRERMRLSGIESVVGADHFYQRLTDGPHAWQRHES